MSLKKLAFAMTFSMLSLAGAEAAERCHIFIKSASTATTVASRVNLPFKNISLKECLLRATNEIKDRAPGSELMLKYTNRAGKVKVLKMENNTPEEFEQFYLY